MINANDMAFPISAGEGNFSAGLTKREYFAAMAMVGLLTNAGLRGFSHAQLAANAVEEADALIEALNSQAAGIVEKTDDV